MSHKKGLNLLMEYLVILVVILALLDHYTNNRD